MSSNPERSRLAQAARLARQAEAAAAAGRVAEAVGLWKEALRLDPADRRALHRLGDLHCNHLKRPLEAAGYFAAKARCEEREGFEARAIASWKLAVRCDPTMLEAHERIGALYVALGVPADARLHYQRTAEALESAGRRSDAAILRAHLATLDPPAAPARPPVPVSASNPAPPIPGSACPPVSGPAANPTPPMEPAPAPAPNPPESAAAPSDDEPDETAAAFAADRMQSARLFQHYGLPAQAREQLEDLLESLPEHRQGRQLLVEVCRTLGDHEAAAEHLRVLTFLLRREGEAQAPAADEPLGLPPVEEWMADETADPMAELVDEIRRDVERALDQIARRRGGR